MKTSRSEARDAVFLDQAIRLSRKGMRANEGGPFGSVVVCGGRVVGRGWNRVLKSHDPTAHAEVEAIRAAAKRLKRFDLSDCVIYASCQPCPMCLSAIYWSGIRRVVYANTAREAAKIGFADQFIYDELDRPPRKRKLCAVCRPSPEARGVFREWAGKADKTPY
ncbi:MAG: nucleoside deaminase [Candidatus Methylacidiphilales bacterium]|nr:nucleoside deaminase [Candidatus Methylacidiphilales bacterium]